MKQAAFAGSRVTYRRRPYENNLPTDKKLTSARAIHECRHI